MERTPKHETVLQNIEDMRDEGYTTADIYNALFLTTDRTGQEVKDLLKLDFAEAQQISREFMAAARDKYGEKEFGRQLLREKAENIAYHQGGPVPVWARDGSAGFIMAKHTPESRRALRRMVDSFRGH